MNTPNDQNQLNKRYLKDPAGHLSVKARMKINLLALFLLPLAALLLLENLFLGGIPFTGKIFALNYVLYAAILLFMVGITGRLKAGSRIFLIVMWLIGCFNYAVLATRMSPIVPWDLYSLSTALSVAGNYSFPFNGAFFLFTGLFAVLFLLTSLLTWRAKSKGRRLSAMAVGVVSLAAASIFSMHPVTKERFQLDDTLFVTRHMAETNGFVLNFIHSFYYLNVNAPKDYSVQRVEEIGQTYLDRLKGWGFSIDSLVVNQASQITTDGGIRNSGNEDPSQTPLLRPDSPELKNLPEIAKYLAIANQEQTRQLKAGEKPDIVVIMNESFSDLRSLQEFTTNIPIMPFIDNLQKNTIKGVVHPAIIGGNTATSEFEFLTGASMAFLPSGSSPYQQYVNGPTPSLVSLLEEQGYSSSAMHPYHSRGWMRHEVYPYFGFDRTKFIYDFKNNRNIRYYVSDESVFQEIRLELNNPQNQQEPQFIFAVTMQNHGGYYGDHDNFDPKVEITSQAGIESLNNYLSLVNETDRALGEFLSILKGREKPTLVLFFGDHQPSDEAAGPLMSGQDELSLSEKRRETPFLLWANYDLDEAQGQISSLNFLANKVLEGAQLELSPWNAFLKDVEAQVPALNDAFYYDKDGTPHNFTDPSQLPEITKDYAIIQYNYLFDVKNRVDEMFTVVRD